MILWVVATTKTCLDWATLVPVLYIVQLDQISSYYDKKVRQSGSSPFYYILP